ncbi:MAG: FAD binding domain-containing protein, partial [Bacteroidales bacterium]|nr:FAD binding domain-containing protein [Bacteroidales bacterium]
ACTVVLAEPDKNGLLSYKAVNSCLLFLPAIHGKQLITVENLADRVDGDYKLHPVQQAIVDLHGTQCGFCTPGIVMSLFALYKSYINPDQDVVEDALTGNLCRCTGYEPILKAAFKSCDGSPDKFSIGEKETASTLAKLSKSNPDLFLETNGQIYFQPKTINSAFSFLMEHSDTYIVNGSTDIALKQTKKFEKPEKILDLSALEELKFYITGKDHVEIGSGLSLETLKQRIEGQLPAFSEMLSFFASKQIREVATPGGNIGTASPIGDTLPLLFAYEARINLISPNGKRTIGIEEFITGYRKTDLKPEELIFSVIIPKNKFVKFYKVSRRKDLDISTVSAGFRINIDKGKVTDICLVYGGMAATPIRASKTESFLFGEPLTEENIKIAGDILYNEFRPISDARADVSFRNIAARNLLKKFYWETKDEFTEAR